MKFNDPKALNCGGARFVRGVDVGRGGGFCSIELPSRASDSESDEEDESTDETSSLRGTAGLPKWDGVAGLVVELTMGLSTSRETMRPKKFDEWHKHLGKWVNRFIC